MLCRSTSVYYPQELADGAAFEGLRAKPLLALTKPLLALTKPLIALVCAIPDGAALEGVRATVDETLIHACRHSVDRRKRLRVLKGLVQAHPQARVRGLVSAMPCFSSDTPAGEITKTHAHTSTRTHSFVH